MQLFPNRTNGFAGFPPRNNYTEQEVRASLSKRGVKFDSKEKVFAYTSGTLGLRMLGKVDFLSRKCGYRRVELDDLA